MRILDREWTIGADPEIFMGKNGVFVSAHDAIEGTKEKPFIVPNGAVQVDGMALEFNVDPSDSLEQFQNNIDSVLDTLSSMIGDHELLSDTSVHFTPEEVEHVPPLNRELGCSSDFDGWTLFENESPAHSSLSQTMRTVGGHVHVGGFPTNDPYDWSHMEKCGRLARVMDSFIGVYSLFWDKDDQRRDLYGKAGCFRPTTYGMEYRSLSNKWIFDKGLTKFVFDGVCESIEVAFGSSYEPDELIKDIINSNLRSHPFFVDNYKLKKLGDKYAS